MRSALRLGDGPVLDPFAGAGTSVLVAGGADRKAVGIEIMPVGALATRAIACVANGLNRGVLEKSGARLLRALDGGSVAPAFRFPHVRITERAFPAETEDAIAKARAFLHRLKDESVRLVLDFACMSVLEEASYTRKDGQYLRWDRRCGRNLRGGMDKGPIPGFADALRRRLAEILQDAPQLAKCYAAAQIGPLDHAVRKTPLQGTPGPAVARGFPPLERDRRVEEDGRLGFAHQLLNRSSCRETGGKLNAAIVHPSYSPLTPKVELHQAHADYEGSGGGDGMTATSRTETEAWGASLTACSKWRKAFSS